MSPAEELLPPALFPLNLPKPKGFLELRYFQN